MIRTRNGYTKSFTEKKEIRQRCVLSPSLFNLYIVDLDRELVKRNIRGITLGGERKKLQSLAYANDIVLLAKNKVTLENMMNTLKGF